MRNKPLPVFFFVLQMPAGRCVPCPSCLPHARPLFRSLTLCVPIFPPCLPSIMAWGGTGFPFSLAIACPPCRCCLLARALDLRLFRLRRSVCLLGRWGDLCR